MISSIYVLTIDIASDFDSEIDIVPIMPGKNLTLAACCEWLIRVKHFKGTQDIFEFLYNFANLKRPRYMKFFPLDHKYWLSLHSQ